MPQSQPKYTIVVLELEPTRDGAKAGLGRLVRICSSGVGRNLELATIETNEIIEASERGIRNVVELHRYRARRVYTKATSLEPIADLLISIYRRARNEQNSIVSGVFGVFVEDAREAVEESFISFPREQQAAKQRALKAKARWKKINETKSRLRSDMRSHCEDDAPHSILLCDVLDGLEGRMLQKWAVRELAKQELASAHPADLASEDDVDDIGGGGDRDIDDDSFPRSNDEYEVLVYGDDAVLDNPDGPSWLEDEDDPSGGN